MQSIKAPGRYTDEAGLMLIVDERGQKRWSLRFTQKGRRRDIGLGSLRDVSLADAREAASEMRKRVRAGVDVIAERRRERQRVKTFEEAARSVHEENKASWKNAKHAAQWISTLETYVFPRLGRLGLDEIDGPLIRDVVAKIWLEKPETARRVLQRIGVVLDVSRARQWRTVDVPAMKTIARSLPRQPKGQEHLAALPWSEVPAFIAGMGDTLKSTEPVLLLMEFTILTVARSGESRGCRWSEIDLEDRAWNIPGERMKGGKPHRVPLCDRAVEILERMLELRHHRRAEENDSLVFEGKPRRPYSDMTMTLALRRAGLQITMHGFRSSFRDWVAEGTNFPRELAEKSLAHALGSRVEASYQRGDLFEKRRKLMNAWASYVAGDKGNVVNMKRRRPA